VARFEQVNEFKIWVKENIQIIVLVPTILGGLWQILELSLISTSMIRFFSISQLVADGLLILFLGGVIYLAYRIGKLPLGKDEFHFIKNKPQKNNGTFRNNIIWCIVAFALSFGVFYFLILPLLHDILDSEYFELPKIFFFILSSYFILILGATAISDFIKIILSVSNDWINKIPQESKLNRVIKPLKEMAAMLSSIIIGMGSIVLLILIISTIVGKFRKSYIFPKKLINVEYLSDNARNYYEGQIDSTEILYVNDKYIFLKIYPSKDEKDILIMNFSDLLLNPEESSIIQ
jgi:hypothetical protein